METKYHIKEYDDKECIIDSQQRELKSFFEKNKLIKLKSDLYQFTIESLSEEPSKKDYTKFIRRLKFLVNFGWELVFQDHKYQVRFNLPNIRFINNPFYLEEKFQSPQFRQRNFGLSGFYGDITSLSTVGAADIYGVLHRFYNEISVISWLNLLDDWLQVTEEDGGLWAFHRSDNNPLKTQKFLLQLIESLYLLSLPDFFAQAIDTPTTHIFDGPSALQDMDIDSLDQYNPYFWLEHIFNERSVDDYLDHLSYLYDPNTCKKQEDYSKSALYDLGRELKIIVQTVWMNIQCKVLPQDWTSVIDAERDTAYIEKLHTQIEMFLSALSPDKPVTLEYLIVQLFDRDWKMLTYKQAIDKMVEHRVCERSGVVRLIMCSIADLKLLIKVCYLMLLEIRLQKATGNLWYR